MLKVFILFPLSYLLFEKGPASDAKNKIEIHKRDTAITKEYSFSIAIDGIQDPIVQTDTPSCIIPFTKAGKLILIKGKADNVEGNFVLDTGAPLLVLNSTYFRNMEIMPAQGEIQTGINGEGSLAQKTMVKQFKLGTINYSKIETDLLNLGHIENVRGVKILGLLGVSMFKECELVIDYEKNEIHLHHINRKERKTYKHPLLNNPRQYDILPFTLKDNRIIIQTKLAQKKMQFVVDYAAESNIIDSRLPGSVLDSVEISGRIVLSGAGTKKVEAITGAMSGFSVGVLQPKELPVIITSLEYSCFSDDACINGVLGYDFLSRYKLVFNFVTQKLYVFK